MDFSFHPHVLPHKAVSFYDCFMGGDLGGMKGWGIYSFISSTLMPLFSAHVVRFIYFVEIIAPAIAM